MKKVTIKDVAALAGVSISAVSYILNDSDAKKYSKETIKKVKDAAKKLSYRPNAIAKGMRTGRSFSLGIANCWDMDNRVFAHILKGVVACASKLGFSVTICPNIDTFSYISYYENRRIDGVLLIAPALSEKAFDENVHIKKLADANVPFSVINGISEFENVSYFNFNYASTTFVATDYLIKNNHSKIAYVSPKISSDKSELAQRCLGYEQRMNDAGFKTSVIDVNDLTPDLLKNYTGVVANKSDTAKLVLDMAVNSGISVPNDLSVIAANTEYYSKYLSVPLTTVQFPFEALGESAAKHTINCIQNSAEPTTQTFNGEIIEASSVSKCK